MAIYVAALECVRVESRPEPGSMARGHMWLTTVGVIQI
jgi:hypothetical protein